MFEGFKAATYQCNGIDIHAVIGGNGPPVLLLHGFPQTHALWAKVAPILAKNYTVVCSDLRGYGQSGKPLQSEDLANYSFREMAKDQFELMKQLGFNKFHLVGHDRGARTSQRLAIDHAEALLSITMMDIIPLYDVFSKVDMNVAKAYWHWYFLQQPYPYPENIIADNPDHFYEGCLFGWGGSTVDDFNAEQLEAYRHAWRQKENIHGSCADYRAAGTVDYLNDEKDLHQKVDIPTLILYGADGVMGQLFNMREAWEKSFPNLETDTVPGGHFFIDQYPVETANRISSFLKSIEY